MVLRKNSKTIGFLFHHFPRSPEKYLKRVSGANWKEGL